MRTRVMSDENIREMLLAQANITVPERGSDEDFGNCFAALTTNGEESAVRAFIVPTFGAYNNAHVDFTKVSSGAQTGALENVRRIFVMAPVWDCYIDGCGIPERRCAWYGNIPLDLPVLESLRRSRRFVELTVEQDMNERAIEVLLPLIDRCLQEGQEFTLVPVFVGGLMPDKAEQYTQLLAPYLSDPSNLFVVAGNVADLGEDLNVHKAITSYDSPLRFINETSMISSDRSMALSPVFDALELFLAALVQAPEREELRLNRFW